MPDVNEETLQRIGQARWGMDAQGALRLATGISMDMQGIARALGGTDNLTGLGTDTLEEILSETQIVTGPKVTPNTGDYTTKIFTADTGSVALSTDSSGVLRALAPTASAAHTSTLRYGFLKAGLTGTDWEATWLCAPQNTGQNPTGSGAIFPQAGIMLRYIEDATPKRRAVVIDNNIAYSSSVMNFGVWSSDLAGAGFLNRQTPSGAAFTNPPFPYWCKVRLVGTTLSGWIWGTNEQFPVAPTSNRIVAPVDLNTVGTITGNETPTGLGGAGLIAAHLGNHAMSEVKWPFVFIRALD